MRRRALANPAHSWRALGATGRKTGRQGGTVTGSVAHLGAGNRTALRPQQGNRAERIKTIWPSIQAAFDAIAFMSKRIGCLRGKVDSVHGPCDALFLIGSAPATFMRSRGPGGTPSAPAPINRTNTRLRPISTTALEEDMHQGACEGSPYMDRMRADGRAHLVGYRHHRHAQSACSASERRPTSRNPLALYLCRRDAALICLSAAKPPTGNLFPVLALKTNAVEIARR